MNNQEVNELMQRYLDNDLTTDELETLTDHLSQSPASAALFERLKQLDSELEQLPKVIPPTSIVDSILPRLELAGLLDDPPNPSTTSIQADANAERVVPMVSKTNLRRRINYKLLGGVVAAGVLLTLFMSDIGPRMSSYDTANDSYESASASNQQAKQSVRVEPFNAVDQSGSTEKSMEAKSDREAPSDEVVENGHTEALSSKAEPASSGSNLGKSSSGDAATDSPGRLYEAAPDAPNSDQAPASNQAPASDHTKSMNMERITAEEKDNGGGSDQEIMFSTISPPPTLVESPNLLFVATITVMEDNQQQILITAQDDGETLYQSKVYPSTLDNLVWSEDSSQLHFDVVISDTATEHMTIDMNTKREIEKQEQP